MDNLGRLIKLLFKAFKHGTCIKIRNDHLAEQIVTPQTKDATDIPSITYQTLKTPACKYRYEGKKHRVSVIAGTEYHDDVFVFQTECGEEYTCTVEFPRLAEKCIYCGKQIDMEVSYVRLWKEKHPNYPWTEFMDKAYAREWMEDHPGVLEEELSVQQ